MKRSFSIRLQVLFWMTVGGSATVMATQQDEANQPSEAQTADEQVVDFGRDIQPLLSDRCYLCHCPDESARAAGLRLDNFAGATLSSIVPGDADGSELIERISSDDDGYRMPTPASHKRALTSDQVDLFRKWINQGAKYEGHWAFKNPVKPAVPNVEGESKKLHAIDAFIQKKLSANGIAPAKRATRRKLLRRASFDLTGLPPTPAQIKAFEDDSNSDQEAWSTALDRLLASVHYGEHQTRLWLDASRYADSNGYQYDFKRDQWAWRDWVIDAFNNNQPFDKFSIQQLAGDLLRSATNQQRLATGFCRNHPITVEGGVIDEEYRIEYVIDRAVTAGTVWMGLTVQCARCHDHKYDPLSQKDFFQLTAFFNNVPEKGFNGFAPKAKIPSPLQAQFVGATRMKLDAADAKFRKLASVWEVDQEKLLQEFVVANSNSETPLPVAKIALAASAKSAIDRTPEEKDAILELIVLKHGDEKLTAAVELLQAARMEHNAMMAEVPDTMVMADRKERRKTYVLDRGEYDKPGEEVEPLVPDWLNSSGATFERNRLGFAKWLMSDDNPLTARVTVNRYWQYLFGIGIVDTPEDFGLQGSQPTHPDLLDWLAVDFRSNGWNVKRLLKQIMMTHAYQQDSAVTADQFAADPENRMLARGPRFRLDAEAIRDAALAVSGSLNKTIGGPSVFPYHPKGLWLEVNNRAGYSSQYQQDTGEKLYRRSLYTFWKRSVAPPSMAIFDAPAREYCQVRRSRTNTPLQAFVMLHDPQFVEAARLLAARMLEEGEDLSAQVQRGMNLTLGRSPTEDELSLLIEAYYGRLKACQADPEIAKLALAVGESEVDAEIDQSQLAAMMEVTRLMLNLSEFVTRE